ncbi:MAG: hypothetical protein ABIJ56_04285 [Pseudomonadota bacterium]
MKLKTTYILILSIMLSLSAGCAFMGAAAESVVPENDCDRDSDCPGEGSVCDTENKVCVSGTSEDRDLLIEVIPFDPDENESLPSQYFEYRGGMDGSQSLSLVPYVEISGIVKWDAADFPDVLTEAEDDECHPDKLVDGQCIVKARIEVSSVGEWPQSLRSVQTARTGQSGQSVRDGDDVDFSLLVAPGAYSIRVVPESPFDSFLPPRQFSKEVEVGDSLMLPVTYGELDGLRRIEGMVREYDEDYNGDSVGSVSVWVIDPGTEKRISSIARIGADAVPDPANEAGNFILYLPSSGDSGDGWGDDFSIAIASSGETPNVPNIKLGPYDFPQLDFDTDGTMDDKVDFEAAWAGAESRLMLPELGVQIQYRATVEGMGPDEAHGPVEGVKVRFYTEIKSGGTPVGSYEIFGATDPDGKITGPNGDWGVWLFEGDYLVSLYPPLDSDYEAAQWSSAVTVSYAGEGDPVQEGQLFQLRTKKTVSGLVLKESDMGSVGFVSVEAYPAGVVAAEPGEFSTPFPRFNAVQSLEDGSFSISLDRGRYDFLFMPEPRSNYPWFWHSSMKVDENDEPLDIEIPDPVAFTGTVLDEYSEPVAEAEIRVYDIAQPPVPEEPVSIRQAGRTTTRADGTFVSLIAP